MTKKQKNWIPRELARIIRRFRILRDWKIEYDTKSIYKAQVAVNAEKKTAVIFDWEGRPRPKDYFLHEVLHIVFYAVSYSRKIDKSAKQTEEMCVQDLCAQFMKLQK